MEAPLISATRAEIICPGHPLTANTAWPAGQQLTKKVQLAGQPTPTPRRVKPSSPSLQQRSCAFSDHKNSESVQASVHLLVWRGPVRALCSARAKEVENYCPQRCCPIIGLIWFEKGVGFQVPFLSIGTCKPVGSPWGFFQDFT